MSLTSGVYTYKMYNAECSQCHTIEDLDLGDVTNKYEAIKKFRKQGWLIGKENLCPYCKRKKEHPEEWNYTKEEE